MIDEFKKFAIRGNMMDLAIGVIIGAAFTSIVNSLVNDIAMPIFGMFLGEIDFSNMSITLPGGSILAYGNFINAVVEFMVIAVALFFLIKQLNKFRGEPAKVENKLCKYCKSSIPKDATRCPNCTSKI